MSEEHLESKFGRTKKVKPLSQIFEGTFEVESYLSKIMDIERLHRRMSLKLLQPADFSNLDIAYNNIIRIIELPIFSNSYLKNLKYRKIGTHESIISQIFRKNIFFFYFFF